MTELDMASRTTMMKDPVCGMTVDETKTKLRSEHEGKVFYFCSASCKTTFDRDPHKYGHPK
jgi:Cu+-exporting ATPase